MEGIGAGEELEWSRWEGLKASWGSKGDKDNPCHQPVLLKKKNESVVLASIARVDTSNRPHLRKPWRVRAAGTSIFIPWPRTVSAPTTMAKDARRPTQVATPT